MKTLKRIALFILVLIVFGILFRSCIYREVMAYKPIGGRPNYAAGDALIQYINENLGDEKNNDIRETIKLSLSITSKQLNFTAEKNNNDPNKLIDSKNAHCVGYAAFFSTTCNYLIKKNKLTDWKATPQIGQMYFLGSNIHSYFKSAFFKDHDFVIIENVKTGEKLTVDPTVNDYFWIDFVAIKK